MRVRATAASIVAVSMLALLTGACGGSSSPDTPTSSTGAAAPALPKGFPKDKVPIPQDLALATALTAEVNGVTFYRVRVGPYGQLDDMNKARTRLAENGIEASVVRQR